MAFTQECFIRNPENKFRLIIELERLGYNAMYLSWRNNIGGSNLVCEVQTWHCTDSDNKPWCIDCGNNEDMFLALAALRDDNDYQQWFVNDVTGTWERTGGYTPPNHMIMNKHKASAKEIVEHFSKKRTNYDQK